MATKNKIVHHWQLEVFQLAREGAQKFFSLSKRFPKEETYSLTDQLRRQGGGSAPARSGSAWFLLLVAPTDYGLQCLWLLVRPHATLFYGGYLALAVVNFVYLVVGAVSRFRELSGLDAAPSTASLSKATK